MKTKKVTITSRLDGGTVPAFLLQCQDCDHTTWFVYAPENVGHVHYQCSHCGVTYCDRCTNDPYDGSVVTTPPGPAGDDTAGKGGAA